MPLEHIGWIDKHIENCAVNHGGIVGFAVICNDQRVKIAVLVGAAVPEGAVQNDGGGIIGVNQIGCNRINKVHGRSSLY